MPPSPVRVFARVSLSLIPFLLALVIPHAHGSPENHDPPPTNWLAGTIAAPRTLTVAPPGPQYILYGDLTVAPGVNLTIEPGVEIVALSNSDFLATWDPVRSEIVVQGTLMAIGTSGLPIVFRDSESLAGSWGGLLVQTGAVARLHYTRLDHARNGVQLFQGTFHGIGARIDAAVTGLYAEKAVACSLTQSFVGNATTGISGGGVFVGDTIDNVTNGISGGLVIRECVVTSRLGGGGTGLILNNANMTPLDTLGVITPVRVSGFGTGAALFGGTIRNTLLHDNGTGIEVAYQSSGMINYCTIADNNLGIARPLGFGATVHLMNSILAFSDVASDLSCAPSPCPTSYGYSLNWAPCGTLVGDAPAAFGPVACFDPEFLNRPAGDYRLAPTSPFTDYSISGGHVGAFGPSLLTTTVGVERPGRRGTIELRAEPNPFSGAVRFRLALSERALATIEIVDAMGRRVARPLPETTLDPGTHVVDFTMRSPAGLYFVRARVGDRSVTRRIVFID